MATATSESDDGSVPTSSRHHHQHGSSKGERKIKDGEKERKNDKMDVDI